MRIHLALALLASTSLALADDSDKDKIEGGYTIVAGERNGQPIPAEEIVGSTVRIAENGIIVTDKAKKDVYATAYKLESTGDFPWKLTLTSKLAPSEGKVAHALLDKKGDTIRLIYSLPGADAPTEFKTKAHQMMFVLKNEHKKGD